MDWWDLFDQLAATNEHTGEADRRMAWQKISTAGVLRDKIAEAIRERKRQKLLGRGVASPIADRGFPMQGSADGT